ncbi:MAG: TonB-linked SusC/RagA family outer membrane protein [Sediminicola sp.]|jgi:TonB-linked SusC/RagA family outer membrane protein
MKKTINGRVIIGYIPNFNSKIKLTAVLLLFCLSGSYAINTFDIRDSDYLDSNNITTIEIISEIDNINITDQDFNLKGTVTDSNGQPLTGANILEKGTTNGTQSDFDGKFSINLSSENAILVVSYLGFLTQEVAVNKLSTINIVLKEDSAKLDEVVVIGYGSSLKKDLTGSVSSISSDELTRIPTTDPIKALQGSAPGVRVAVASGAPGSSAIIRIRGANSLSAGNEPLYVVDGVLLDGSLGSEVSVNDIKSIDILKDASSTAIYGSRGANGVVVITTKRGRSGKTVVTFDSYISTQSIIKKLGLLNANDFKTLHSEAFAANGVPTDPSIINSTVNVDWQDELYQNALQQNHHISISGGNEKSTYYLSTDFLDQEGLIKTTGFKRTSFRLNSDHNLTDNLKIRQNLTLSRGSDNFINIGALANAVLWAPPTLPVQDEDGNYTVVSQPFARTNPIGLRDLTDFESKSLNIIGNVGVEWKIGAGFIADINYGYEEKNINTETFLTSGILGSNGDASKSSLITTNWLTDYLIKFEPETKGDHSIKALVGMTMQESEISGTTASNSLFPDEAITTNALQNGTLPRVSSSKTKSSLISYLGRVNYSFKDKYLLTLSGRYDGSSRLSAGNQYAFFPSGALAWRLGEESFINELNFFDDLKLRVSYGFTGNQAVSPVSAFTLLRTVSYSDAQLTGFVPSRLGNENLKWEKTGQFDIGIDFSILDNALSFSADYYKKNTTDLLLNIQLPASSGFITAFGDTATSNIGEVENKGFEFSVSGNYKTGNLSWNTSFNVFTNRAKVLDLGLLPDGSPKKEILSGGLIVRLGETPFQPYGQTVTGIGSNGEFTFKDNDGNGSITDLDRTIIGDLQPDFSFGLSNNIKYKDFDFSFQLVGSIGQDIYAQAIGASYALNGQFNILQSVFDQRGITAPSPRSNRSGSQNANTEFIFDGSYARFRDISLSYTFPEAIFKTTGNLRIYASAQNMISFVKKNYPLYDPEMSSSGSQFGIDSGGYPTFKSITFGLSLKL